MMNNMMENENKIRMFQFFLHWKCIRCYSVYLAVNLTIAEWPPSLNKQLMSQALWSKILCQSFHVLIHVLLDYIFCCAMTVYVFLLHGFSSSKIHRTLVIYWNQMEDKKDAPRRTKVRVKWPVSRVIRCGSNKASVLKGKRKKTNQSDNKTFLCWGFLLLSPR